ncbi:toll/interleukin-1 receptor domain-containing protein [Streptomyces sp. NPDC096152]|uniref:toll/interleukin-1 receptor domain-containing protein n=1 Tax=Streptomyces sp. NPDC096152 TaxID=3366078 RepID=UPI0037F71BF7
MTSWHSFDNEDWTYNAGSKTLFGHGGGIGDFATSYAVDTSLGTMLNGRVSAEIRLTSPTGTGAGLVCRADLGWTFVAFHTVSPNPVDHTAVARFSVLQEGVLVPIAQLPEPITLSQGFNRFSLEFYSGRMRGEIRTGKHEYELLATCPHVPFPGHVGLVKFYGAAMMAKSVTAERTLMPFVTPTVLERTRKGQDFSHDVFLCHASPDKPEVESLAERLRERGIRCWLDSGEIRFGDRLTQRIQEGLRGSRYVLPCISPNFPKSIWAQSEYGFVLNAELSGDSSRTVVPLMLDDAEPQQIPELLRDVRRVNTSNQVEFEEFIAFLLSH